MSLKGAISRRSAASLKVRSLLGLSDNEFERSYLTAVGGLTESTYSARTI